MIPRRNNINKICIFECFYVWFHTFSDCHVQLLFDIIFNLSAAFVYFRWTVKRLSCHHGWSSHFSCAHICMYWARLLWRQLTKAMCKVNIILLLLIFLLLPHTDRLQQVEDYVKQKLHMTIGKCMKSYIKTFKNTNFIDVVASRNHWLILTKVLITHIADWVKRLHVMF
jgi:hypothetical protein